MPYSIQNSKEKLGKSDCNVYVYVYRCPGRALDARWQTADQNPVCADDTENRSRQQYVGSRSFSISWVPAMIPFTINFNFCVRVSMTVFQCSLLLQLLFASLTTSAMAGGETCA